MTSDHIRKFFAVFFVLGFFAYLFGPLIIMSLTAFNSSAFPRVTPWECFSVEWFQFLSQDAKLIEGLQNSIFIGLGVVVLAVPLGLSGALMLTHVQERIRPWYYTVSIAPILVPGVVLGISTLLFWDRVGAMFGASRESIFYNGFFLTIVGQATFISAYTMLVFISRLQRFDRVQEEAALDLGASHCADVQKNPVAVSETRHRLGGGVGVSGFLRELQHDRVHHHFREHADHVSGRQGSSRD